MSLPGLNWTQVPNIFIDKYMAKCSASATKVFLTINRKTVGFHKNTDLISLSQLKQMTGMAIGTIKNAIIELEKLDLISKEKCGQSYKYSLKFDTMQNSAMSKIDIDNNETMSKIDIVDQKTMSNFDNTKEKESKEIIIKESAVSTKPPDDLLTILWKSFLAKNNNKFACYPKERKGLSRLIEMLNNTKPDDVDLHDWARMILETFWSMIHTGQDKFIRNCPFTPSILASGLFENVRKQVMNKTGSVDLEYQKIIDDLFQGG